MNLYDTIYDGMSDLSCGLANAVSILRTPPPLARIYGHTRSKMPLYEAMVLCGLGVMDIMVYEHAHIPSDWHRHPRSR